MLLGYARVSTIDQDLNTQLSALTAAGCDKIFKEKVSGALGANRPALERLKESLRPGDILVVWKLDRLGRSVKELLKIIEELAENRVHLKSIHEQLDTSTPTGKLTFHIFSALAEFERSIVSFRTKSSLAELKKHGMKLGRRPGLSETAQKKARTASVLYKAGQLSVNEICQAMDITLPTLYNYLAYTKTPKKYDLRKEKVLTASPRKTDAENQIGF